MQTEELTRRVDGLSARHLPTVLRWTAAMLWLANVNWKVPPDFGRSGGNCTGLCRYVQYGVDNPVLPGSAWVFDSIISPNLSAFGWITLITESLLVILLVSGRYIRVAAIVGVAQSFGIGLSVANAPGEWYWSYALMIALHLGILATVASARPQTARTMGIVTAGYGVALVIVHAGAGLDGSGDWTLFSQGNAFPGEWGSGTFPGSIAIGLGFVLIGAAGWWIADHVAEQRRRIIGWILVAVGALVILTYEEGGLIIGLGSRPGNACILAAMGLALAVTPWRRSDAEVSEPLR